MPSFVDYQLEFLFWIICRTFARLLSDFASNDLKMSEVDFKWVCNFSWWIIKSSTTRYGSYATSIEIGISSWEYHNELKKANLKEYCSSAGFKMMMLNLDLNAIFFSIVCENRKKINLKLHNFIALWSGNSLQFWHSQVAISFIFPQCIKF